MEKLHEYGTLLTWTLDHYEIIIFYDKENPFAVWNFAISVDSTNLIDAYDLFECMSSSTEEIEVRAEIRGIAEFLISYKKGILCNPLVKEWVNKNYK